MSMGSLQRFTPPFRTSAHLSQGEAYELMHGILSAEMSTEEIAAVLLYLRRKGETVGELVGCAQAIRDRSIGFEFDQSEEPILDTCGTGGDNCGTFNISTAAAFVLAGTGLRVAKHGNRRISSKCGSWDVLERLGIRPDLPVELVRESLHEVGLAFLYAPGMHPAVRHATEARHLLQGRTIFNLLGPLTNPLGAKVQLIGAYSVRAAELLAHAAVRLGVQHAYVVHGTDGLDEITTTADTIVFHVDEGSVKKGRWSPDDFGFERASPEDLAGGDPDTNAAYIQELLDGEPGSRRNIVIANAAAALLVARRVPDLKTAMLEAAASIDSGAARRKLEALRAISASVSAESMSHESV